MDIMQGVGLKPVKFSEVDVNPNEINLNAGLEVFVKVSMTEWWPLVGDLVWTLPKWWLLWWAVSSRLGLRRHRDWWTRADASSHLSIVAVPTTAGTGSEVGRASVITNSETHEKKIIYHPKVLPAVVICDPELTFGMPSISLQEQVLMHLPIALKLIALPLSSHGAGDRR